MKRLFPIFTLLCAASVFATTHEVTSPRSELRLHLYQDGRGGIIRHENKSIAVIDQGVGAPTIFIEEAFPYSVTFDAKKRDDVIGLIVLQRPYSSEASSNIVDAIEIVSSGGLRFVSEESLVYLIDKEQEGRRALQAYEDQLFNKK